MKRLVFAAGFLAFLLTCQAGSARTLEEVLKEKGVITEADFKEVTAARPVTYQLGKGFTFTSPDARFQLSLGGRGQFQYQYLDKDDVNGPAQDVSVWKIRRFKLFRRAQPEAPGRLHEHPHADRREAGDGRQTAAGAGAARVLNLPRIPEE